MRNLRSALAPIIAALVLAGCAGGDKSAAPEREGATAPSSASRPGAATFCADLEAAAAESGGSVNPVRLYTVSLERSVLLADIDRNAAAFLSDIVPPAEVEAGWRSLRAYVLALREEVTALPPGGTLSRDRQVALALAGERAYDVDGGRLYDFVEESCLGHYPPT